MDTPPTPLTDADRVFALLRGPKTEQVRREVPLAGLMLDLLCLMLEWLGTLVSASGPLPAPRAVAIRAGEDSGLDPAAFAGDGAARGEKFGWPRFRGAAWRAFFHGVPEAAAPVDGVDADAPETTDMAGAPGDAFAGAEVMRIPIAYSGEGRREPRLVASPPAVSGGMATAPNRSCRIFETRLGAVKVCLFCC